MKKISILSLITALSCGSYVQAGTMGPIDTTPCLISFLALEGGYTWNEIDGYNFSFTGVNRLYSHKSDKGGSGRVAGGIIRPINKQFALSSEIGFGYYGRTTLDSVNTGLAIGLPGHLNVRNTLSGFDALAGVAFTTPNYSVFFKAGALVQNMAMKTITDFTPFTPTLRQSFHQKINHTAALPELKVGGAYNVATNWALTASYLHAFGSSPGTTAAFNLNNGSAHFNTNVQNPSIDTVLLGIQYSI